MSHQPLLFSSPRYTHSNTNFRQLLTEVEIVFENVILQPEQIDNDDLALLFDGADFNGDSIVYQDEKYNVSIRENNLVIVFNGPENENSKEVKTFITDRLKDYEQLHSDVNTLIVNLIAITNSAQALQDTASSILSKYRDELRSTVDEAYWEKFGSLADDSVQQFSSEIFDIYLRYYTRDEIIELIEFYQSPIGVKVVSVSPQLASESLRVGEKLAVHYMQLVESELTKDGYLTSTD